MKNLLIVLLVSACTGTAPAYAWEVGAMNDHVDQTNFVVGEGCTGTLIDLENRYILTNNHCITKYYKTEKEQRTGDDGVVTEVKVAKTKDVPVKQNIYEGHQSLGNMTWTTEIVAKDKDLDLAVLQIINQDIPQTIEAELYNGPLVVRGETVYAVGNPLGLDASVGKGIISSTTRPPRS